MKTKNKLKLALVQPDTAWEDAESNRFVLTNLIAEMPDGVDVVIMPEVFTTGFTMNASLVAETMSGSTVEWMKQIASERDFAICGSLIVSENNCYYNRFVWVYPDGEIVTYDKRHLFTIEKETKNYTHGKSLPVISYRGWKILPQICYDLRFPVWSRNTQGYDLMINIANWPAKRRKIWKTLTKARAIENQCYVAAVNRIGNDETPIDYTGDSMVINFKGKPILNAESDEGFFIKTINKEKLNAFRQSFNTLRDADKFELLE
ncbi:MAG: amidohydrolase [Prolixibacteraceae bacterium]|jgi:omega-amidase|nr:amidohydrolase [Prolixibacteraceae bacterium]